MVKRFAKKSTRKAVTKKDAAAIVKRALRKNLELKMYNTSATEEVVSTLLQGDGSNWYPLCSLTQGTTNFSRVGNQIRLQKLDIRGSLHNNASVSNLVRMVIFYFKDNVTVSASSDIFLAGTSGTDFAAITGITAMHYPLNPVKMTVLSDTVINLAKAGEYESTKTFRKTFDLKNKLIKFEGNTAGPDNQHPQLYMLVFAAEAANDTGLGTDIELSHYCRTSYTDA